MSIIRTKQNHVAAYEPLPGDVAVVTRLGTAQSVQPIQQYRAAVQEAVNIADHMRTHVDVVPIDTDELLARAGMTPESFVASMTDEERDQLRQDSINACTDAMRYSDEPEVITEAVETLAMLGIVSGRPVH